MLLFKCHGLFENKIWNYWYQKIVDGMVVLTFFISNSRVTTLDILLTTIVDEDTFTQSCSIVFVLISLAWIIFETPEE